MRPALAIIATLFCIGPAQAQVDFLGLVEGAELLRLEGGDSPGQLRHRPESGSAFTVDGLAEVFPPAGLMFGPDAATETGATRLGYGSSGTILLAVDERVNTDEEWQLGQAIPGSRSREQMLSRFEADNRLHEGAAWYVFGSTPINYARFENPPETNNTWQAFDEVVEDGQVVEPGRLLFTWENVPGSYQIDPFDRRRNSFQMLLTHVGDGDADIEIRYARCEWHNQIQNSYYIVTGFHAGVKRGFSDRVRRAPGQRDWFHPDAFSPRIKRMCLYSNIGQRGIYHYTLRDGAIAGCGTGRDYVPNDDDAFGDVCEDNDNTPGDGCSPMCFVEKDLDGDGLPEAPPQEPRNADGTLYNPEAIYDNCLEVDEFNCSEDDFDGDNILDREDNCPRDANRNQADFDRDGTGDVCEFDADGDGFPNDVDYCISQYSYVVHGSYYRAEQFNRPAEEVRMQLDNDGDAFDPNSPSPGGDPCDPDDDNDGVSDCGEDNICPYFDDGMANRFPFQVYDFPGEGLTPANGLDDDLDGRIDESVLYFDRMFAEGSGLPSKVRDLYDNDADGIVDELDEQVAPGVSPVWPGRDEGEDNCRTVFNPDQANLDGDVYGDACDPDLDGDYVLNCGADGFCSFLTDRVDNDQDGEVDEAFECSNGCPPRSDGIDNDQDGYIDEDRDGGIVVRRSSEALLDFVPWPGPDLDGSEDNCPFVRNVEQLDTDGDGVGDACDDDDGDGAFFAAEDPPIEPLVGQHAPARAADNCPGLANPDQLASDDDAFGDACDDDDDNDTIPDAQDSCPTHADPYDVDLDEDGLGDVCDPDIDGDGLLNEDDACPYEVDPTNADLDRDGLGDVCDDDIDGDDLSNSNDNCPESPRQNGQTWGESRNQANSDTDEMGDLCDPDDDNDGVLDEDDNCPKTHNPSQLNTDRTDEDDGEVRGDACDDDADNDGRPNTNDNCPSIANPDQTNTDNADDGGDVCDDDDDNDGYPDTADACPHDPDHHLDTDNDGLGDGCGDTDDDGDGILDADDTLCPLVANPAQGDIDGDLLGDECDGDMDGDAIANVTDNCQTVANLDQANQDGDEFGDVCDDDRDGDGRDNSVDNCPNVANPSQADTDFNGIGDACASTPTAEQLRICRANTKPIHWPKCGGPSKSLGCAATPGAPLSNSGWILAALILLRRRRA